MTQDIVSLTLEPRETIGKAVKQLRREGIVPAVVHDHGKPSLIVQANGVELLKVWRKAGKHHPVQLTANGKPMTALIKEAEFDPRRHDLTHVVFNAVNANQTVTAEVPIQAQYEEGNESSPAERASLLVLAQLEAVEVEAIPSKLPDVLYYNAEVLVDVGDHVTVADLIVPADVVVMTDASHSVATVYEPSAMAAANDAAGGDADAGDEEVVPADTADSTDPEGQAQENHPGGRKEKESAGE
jgi:large subunit ribosomal protein L25